jgi:two-component system, NtrC family, sensor kinase
LILQPVLQQFDRDLSLRDLLHATDAQALVQALDLLLGQPVRILDLDNSVVAGSKQVGVDAACVAVPLTVQLDTVGFLEAAGPLPRVQAAASMVEQVLRAGARYCMAADLHMESVRSDHQRFQDEHAALLASEARLRELSDNLDRRVNEQVRTIEDSQRSMYQAEKLASVGQLAAGVAHEINNPLGFLRSNLHTARAYIKTLSALEPLVESDHGQAWTMWHKQGLNELLTDFDALLSENIHGTDRVTKIVSDLKSFASMDSGADDLLDLNDNLRVVCNVAQAHAPAGACILTDLQALPLLKCQAGRINQVFLNVLLNAVQALEPGGEVRVASAFVGDEIMIAFKDNGCGIPSEELGRIFDPFFTTREVGSGTGLGLTVSRDVVRSYGGILDVQSEVGAGTSVTIRLPLQAG